MEKHHDRERQNYSRADRPALRQVREAKLPPGQDRLPDKWWENEDLEPGTTLLARALHRRLRAKLRGGYPEQDFARNRVVFKWSHGPDLLWCPSTATH
jgi:hypothetical protein